jgi:hypothetical protein
LRGSVLQLPSELVLAEGQRYRWSIFAKAPDGINYSSSHRFTVADATGRAEVENFRPAQAASPSERVAFAIWLEQAGVDDEALRYWQQLGADGILPPPEKSATAK